MLKSLLLSTFLLIPSLVFSQPNVPCSNSTFNLVVANSTGSVLYICGTNSQWQSLNVASTPLYTLNVQALTSSPTDAQVIYFGQLPKAPVTVQGTSRIYIRRAGTIRQVQLLNYSGTAGTNEAWVCNVRLNNTGDTSIASVALNTNERVWFNSNLNLAVTTSDYIEVKCTNPTWATNPLTSIFAGYLIIEG